MDAGGAGRLMFFLLFHYVHRLGSSLSFYTYPALSKSSGGKGVNKYFRQFSCYQRPYNTIETGKIAEIKQRTINKFWIKAKSAKKGTE